MATESQFQQASGSVRTYRGRTLEEILPQIRAELGSDAMILREREGLVGGVGGFFAQRFVEVDARRGDGQSIDIYDDAPESDLRSRGFAGDPEPAIAEPAAELPPEPTEIGRHLTPLPQELPRASEPRPFVPPAITLKQPPAPVRKFEATVFMDRLREASAVLPDAEIVDLTPPVPEPVKPARKARAAAKPKPAPKPKRKTGSAPPRPHRQPTSGWAAEIEAMPGSARETATARDLMAMIPAPAATEPLAPPRPPPSRPRPVKRTSDPRAKPTRAPRGREAPAARELPAARESPAIPSLRDPIRRRPRSILPELPAPARGALPATTTGTALSRTVIAPRPGTREHHDDGLRGTLGRLVEGLRQTGPTRPAPAMPLDLVAATNVASQLSTRGASQAWTSQLISAAGAHGSPLLGDLRAAAEAEVARRIVPAPALPVSGAAIAFIGAGGSGKTRCTAALAHAYRHASTLEVTVVALDNPDGARELRRLLRDDNVPVLSLSGEKALRAVSEARDGGLVIVDTVAATPTDPVAVRALGARLEPLELDAVYVTLPATLGPQAARRALASFATLRPSAVAITHADETDQLAVVVEIAVAHRIPLAYFHSGTDHRISLSAVDPPAVAQQLLP